MGSSLTFLHSSRLVHRSSSASQGQEGVGVTLDGHLGVEDVDQALASRGYGHCLLPP